ncbi:MAG TPA: carbamoyl-phosphate synthase large subunit [Acidimicrobiales bacterium]|nr:carbamoyl-phosphate synthase large subunit [Acidimicrobiales bacterium]
MPRRSDIETILVIGSGPIVIGQACEFDYSGSQACRVLRAEGYRVVLANSNPATIMTDPELADRTYIEPLDAGVLAAIVERERPDALLPTLGGQTGLNLAMALEGEGVLDRFGVELIGANAQAITTAEDRRRFSEAMGEIGLEVPPSGFASSLEEAMAVGEAVGYPIMVRPSFILGGAGTGTAKDRAELARVAAEGLAASPVSRVLIERSIAGWKEFELEVMRDRADNCVVVCSIENFDPMGVHTGDSITVAPAQTLSDVEYQAMRDDAFACIRRVGVETGGSNIQFAVDPRTGRRLVIEMNPRVSRSSALASKATGFPIAKIAARLAVGYTLDEIANDITGATPASFEPTIDYVVTKIPRWAFEKLPGSVERLGTRMQSVGEVMAIGRTFCESLQKAIRSLEQGRFGLNADPAEAAYELLEDSELVERACEPTPQRVFQMEAALRRGVSPESLAAATGVDPWFVGQLQRISAARLRLEALGRAGTEVERLDRRSWRELKRHGFSDAQVAYLLSRGRQGEDPAGPVADGAAEGPVDGPVDGPANGPVDGALDEARARAARLRAGVRPTFKTVDTCGAEFAASTPYHYATYEDEDEVRRSERPRVMILGSGPNRIGQGIEFDYCCVHASMALREAGYETVMVNCNPETVSTDYDTSDRLYFEPLTAEDVANVIESELRAGEHSPAGVAPLAGVIVSLGGQTPLKLAHSVDPALVLGTAPASIDLAEDRERWNALCETLRIPQPPGGAASTVNEALAVAAKIGYPVLVRPSYVLGGRAMEIVYDDERLEEVFRALEGSLRSEGGVSSQRPVLIDRFLEDAVEVDVDSVRDAAGEVFVAGIMEHVEEAGVHSGDSACALPPQTLAPSVVAQLEEHTRSIAASLGVVGLLNVQFAVKDSVAYVLEANPRASRTVPFVAKATGIPLAKVAARVMMGATLAELREERLLRPRSNGDWVSVKEAVLPFDRFPGVDSLLGPEMRSTGEVMGIARSFGLAFAKSQIAAGTRLPSSGTVFLSLADRDKASGLGAARGFADLGLELAATSGTAAYLESNGVKVSTVVGKVGEVGAADAVELISSGRVQLVVNTPRGRGPRADGLHIRSTASLHQVPCLTTVAAARAAAAGIADWRRHGLSVISLQEVHGEEAHRPESEVHGEAAHRPDSEVHGGAAHRPGDEVRGA